MASSLFLFFAFFVSPTCALKDKFFPGVDLVGVEVPVGTPLEPEAGKEAIKAAMGDMAKDVMNAVSPVKVDSSMVGKAVEALSGDKMDTFLKDKLSKMSSKDIHLIPKALHLVGAELANAAEGKKVDGEHLRQEIEALPFSEELMKPHKRKFGFKNK